MAQLPRELRSRPPLQRAPSRTRDADIDVLRRVADGDKAALGVLYDRYASAMLSLGLRILAVRREAEDLVHDVFLEAWQHAGDYDAARGSVKAWLLLRMRSRCLDRARSHGFSRHETLDRLSTRAAAIEPADRHIDAARAQSLLEALPLQQREILELGYFNGLSFSEISRALRIPLGTVKSRAAAALTKLREDLGVREELPSRFPEGSPRR